MDKQKYKEYDKIVARTLEYFLKKEEYIDLDYFNGDKLELYLLSVADIACNFSQKKIRMSTTLTKYIKFKIKYRKIFKKVIRKKFPKLGEFSYDSNFYMKELFPDRNIEETAAKLENIYDEYYKI